MKALSLHQPYADLIVEGAKKIELRKWNTKFRGEFLVHASKVSFTDYPKERTGCIVGKVKLVDVKHYDNEEAWKADVPLHRADYDFIESNYGFILANPVKFDVPIPCAGSLNFWEVSAYTLQKLPGMIGDKHE